jgi:hypothetical protein
MLFQQPNWEEQAKSAAFLSKDFLAVLFIIGSSRINVKTGTDFGLALVPMLLRGNGFRTFCVEEVGGQ